MKTVEPQKITCLKKKNLKSSRPKVPWLRFCFACSLSFSFFPSIYLLQWPSQSSV
ncbi:hypothetical protein BDZ91DRAFT_712179 [Kalaharituber pfeilii]|nr:hypothetical protein BDZ91DRAFT_712179 [Kalaharituber pfeilii]